VTGRIAAAAAVLLLPALPAAAVDVATTIQAGDPFYRELDRAQLLGLTDGPSLGTYPLSRAEAFRLLRPLAAGITREGGETPVPVDPERGLRSWVSPSLTRARDFVNPWPVFWEREEYPTTFGWSPLHRVELAGSDIARGDSAPEYLDFGESRSEGLSLVRDGDFFVEGETLALDASLRLRFDRSAVTLRPITLVARGGIGNVRLTLGREPLSWGPERAGGLLISNNARPLDQLRLESDSPWRLPGFLDRIGVFNLVWFLGRLDDPGRSDYPNPWLTGTRLSYAPFPWLALGASRTVMLGGEGNPYIITWSSLKDLFLGVNENRDLGDNVNNTDQKASVDWSVYLWPLARHVPVLDGGRLYGRYAGEDSPQNGPLPSAPGTTYGLELVLLGVLLRAEASRVIDDSNVWYRHNVYTDGYTYRGRVLGHPMDGDARAQTYRVEAPLGAWGLVEGGMERQEKGFSSSRGYFPGGPITAMPQGVQDMFHLGVEKYLGRFPGTLAVEGRFLRTWRNVERLGPLEDWGVSLTWRR